MNKNSLEMIALNTALKPLCTIHCSARSACWVWAFFLIFSCCFVLCFHGKSFSNFAMIAMEI